MRTIYITILLLATQLTPIRTKAQILLETPNVESKLYEGIGENKGLIVGLGGSEGGNAWSSNQWKETRDSFLNKGYAFLALGYFGAPGTPKVLDKIALEAVYFAIQKAKIHPKIQAKKVAIVGGSRGADLALLLGSYYEDINAIVALAPSHAVFPGHTQTFDSSCWTFAAKELPYIPVNDAAVPFLIKGDLRGTFAAMMTDTIAEKKALIQIEKINGPILLVSAKADEIIPAVAMGKKLTDRLKEHSFKHPFEHLIVEGSHSASMQQFERVQAFLEKHF